MSSRCRFVAGAVRHFWSLAGRQRGNAKAVPAACRGAFSTGLAVFTAWFREVQFEGPLAGPIGAAILAVPVSPPRFPMAKHPRQSASSEGGKLPGLAGLRSQIDRIDRDLVALMNERAEVARQIEIGRAHV